MYSFIKMYEFKPCLSTGVILFTGECSNVIHVPPVGNISSPVLSLHSTAEVKMCIVMLLCY